MKLYLITYSFASLLGYFCWRFLLHLCTLCLQYQQRIKELEKECSRTEELKREVSYASRLTCSNIEFGDFLVQKRFPSPCLWKCSAYVVCYRMFIEKFYMSFYFQDVCWCISYCISYYRRVVWLCWWSRAALLWSPTGLSVKIIKLQTTSVYPSTNFKELHREVRYCHEKYKRVRK